MNNFIKLYDIRIKLDSIVKYEPYMDEYVDIILECGASVMIYCESQKQRDETLQLLDNTV
jgi:hypothetical protein